MCSIKDYFIKVHIFWFAYIKHVLTCRTTALFSTTYHIFWFAHIKHFITCRFTALFSTTSRRQWFEVLCKMCHCVSMMTYVFVSVCVWLWEEIWLWFLQIDYSNSFIPSDYKRIPVLNFLSLELNSIPTQSRQRRKTRNHLFPVVKLIISTHCYYC